MAASSARRAVTSRVGTPRPGTLRLWTIQGQSVWESLQRDRRVAVDLAQIGPDFFSWPWAYDWMREQMARRLPGYQGHYPWWAWFRPKPDLRRWSWWMSAGEPYVRLELALAPERVLFSVEPAWVAVLNRSYVGIDHADYAAWNTELAQAGLEDWWDEALPEPWRARVAASWERIFEVEALTREEWSDAVQAKFEWLELADVVAVTEFTGRGRPEEHTERARSGRVPQGSPLRPHAGPLASTHAHGAVKE